MRDRLWQIGEEQLHQLASVDGRPCRGLTLSFSQNFLSTEFRHGSIQLSSGELLVVFNENTDQVYKLPFGHRESHWLIIFLLMNRQGVQSQLISMLFSNQDSLWNVFFEFKALLPPVTVLQAKSSIKEFTDLVHNSLQESCAHLDVRIDNVSFCPLTNGFVVAVLVDLDRALEVTKPLCFIDIYGKKICYMYVSG